VDRVVHRLAFGGGPAQQMLCDLESRFFGDRIAREPVESPIFVTALPRAGTTLLLEILSVHPEVVTHTYRDMPFVLSPLMWRKLTSRFQVRLSQRERAHSDGMLVDADSAEAFEEVLWLRLFPEFYEDEGIRLWTDDCTRIEKPLTGLIKRLIASRRFDGAGTLRYASKNNANIARLPALRNAFRDARLVIPLRHPVDHAVSLHRQHARFLEVHSQSDFAMSYMRDIGHFEFGALHRPILFKGIREVIEAESPQNLDYWLMYWVSTYRQLAELKDVIFIDMETLTNGNFVGRFLSRLGLSQDPYTISAAQRTVRPMKSYKRPHGVADGLAEEAVCLYEEIRSAAQCRL
jgi:hypothetical protein